MNEHKRVELIIENWFKNKMNLSLNKEQIKSLTSRILHNQPLNIYGVGVSFCDIAEEIQLQNNNRLEKVVWNSKRGEI